MIRGTIPPGAVVPMHTHADPETFFEVTGTPEGLVHTDAGFRWEPIRPGDVFHVPGRAKHAFRNHSSEPAVMIVTTTSRIGRFFREVASPPAGSDPLLHFLRDLRALRILERHARGERRGRHSAALR